MSNNDFESDLTARLHRAAHFARVPAPAHRIDESFERSRPCRSRRPALIAGAVAVCAALVAAMVVSGHRGNGRVMTGPPATSVDDSLAAIIGPGQVASLPDAPVAGRVGPASAWTGEEMLIWGGSQPQQTDGEVPLADGAAYNPRTQTWRTLSTAPITGRAYAAAVWTGTEFVIWGGSDNGRLLADGAAYNPTTDSWRTLAPSPLRGAMKSAAVWTGKELLVIGGLNGDSSSAAYDPALNTWRSLPDAPGLVTAPYAQAVWNGTFAYVVLTDTPSDSFSLAAFDPTRSTWQVVPDEFNDRYLPFLALAGDKIVAITTAEGVASNVYNPDTGAWMKLPPIPDTLVRADVAISTPPIWTGNEILLWSGGQVGLRLNIDEGVWNTFPAGDLVHRSDGVAVWASGVLLTWGGFVSQPDGHATAAADGVIYAPDHST